MQISHFKRWAEYVRVANKLNLMSRVWNNEHLAKMLLKLYAFVAAEGWFEFRKSELKIGARVFDPITNTYIVWSDHRHR